MMIIENIPGSGFDVLFQSLVQRNLSSSFKSSSSINHGFIYTARKYNLSTSIKYILSSLQLSKTGERKKKLVHTKLDILYYLKLDIVPKYTIPYLYTGEPPSKERFG